MARQTALRRAGSEPAVPKYHLDRPGALTAPWHARTGKVPRWFRGRITRAGVARTRHTRRGLGDTGIIRVATRANFPRGGNEHAPATVDRPREAGSIPARSQNAAASGDRRIDPIATAACARGAFASRSQSLRANSTPDRAKGIRRAARPAPKGQRKS